MTSRRTYDGHKAVENVTDDVEMGGAGGQVVRNQRQCEVNIQKTNHVDSIKIV